MTLFRRTDVVVLMVEGRIAELGRTMIFSGVIKPKKTLAQIKATLTAVVVFMVEGRIVLPRHRRPDVTFSHFHLLSNILS
jgi:hypothetical protein